MYQKREDLPNPLHIQMDRREIVPEITIEVKIKDAIDRDLIKREIRETARRIHHLTNKRVGYSVKIL